MSEDSKIPSEVVKKEHIQEVNSNKDSIEFEYNTIIQEYQMVSDRISKRIDADERGIELNAVAISAVLAASSIIIDRKIYMLLLLLALPFNVLIWAYIKRAIEGYHLLQYVTKVLAPRLNTIIQKTSINYEKYGKPLHFLSWEGYVSNAITKKTAISLVMELSHGGRILLQFLAAIVLFFAYLFLRANNPQYVVSALDTGLLILNVLITFVSFFYLIITYIYVRGKSSPLIEPIK